MKQSLPTPMVWVYMVILLLTFALMPSPLAKDPYTTSEMARTSRTDAWISTGRPFSADPAPPCLLSHHPRDWAPGASPPAPSGSCPQQSSSLLAMSVFSLMALSIVETLYSGTLAFGKWQHLQQWRRNILLTLGFL